MRNLILFLFHLLCFATANHALAQQKVLVSDYFFKEDSASVQNKLLNIQEYRSDHFLTAHHQYKRTVSNYFEYASRI